MDKALREFLRSVVNSRIKFDVVSYFLRNKGVFPSADELAVKIGRDSQEVKQALKELHAAGILLFTPFGYEDICFLNGDRHTPDIKKNLRLLQEALVCEPSQMEEFLRALDKKDQP